MFVNLLTNAAQAIEPGAPERNCVTVRSRVDPDGRIVAEISDTGCGMAESQLGRIFDPFYSARRTGLGTGLGLAICHGIVTAMGGTIEVESELGVGTTFRVGLPPAGEELATHAADAPQAAEPEPAAPRPGASTSGAATLLIIEDDEMIRAALARLLSPPYELVMASGGREALALFEQGRRFPLILCDLTMPDVNGMDLLRSLNERWPDQAQRVLFMTGGATNEAAAQFLDTAPLGHVEKPFDRVTLRRRIAALLLELEPLTP
ncbi:MAG: response regulator [Myxococcales bacterium]|nr:response regulator [Myxococcales bacterium]